MPSKNPFRGYGKIAIVTAQTSLPTPPVFVGRVDDSWNQGSNTPDDWDIEVKAAAAVDLTLAEIVGVVQDQLAIASDDVDVVDFANNELDIATHGLLDGDGPLQLTTTGVLPTGLALLTDYYVINAGAGSISLALSVEDALEGTAIVTFSDVGSGTHSILGSESGNFMTGSNNSFRIWWLSYGLIGPAADGAISITAAAKGYSTRISHRPRTIAYGVEATLSSAVAVTVSAYPVQDAK